ncbi:hypothetical protein BT63DRAFT_475727 [Microthyrium microscopicum]|uniref:Uncharacterized protein n=1 Tax=Microthyrium microscopicum TaxID=703497 RepID=A0A6A6UQI3_9PEZI|nr:hypothetical protein BT63DRAFT_475727 [Microthyrium microscopicum]
MASSEPKNKVFITLNDHLGALYKYPSSTSQDTELYMITRYALTQIADFSLTPEDCLHLTTKIYHVLPLLNPPSTEIIQLLQRLVERVPIEGILDIEPPVDFAAGLQIGSGVITDFNNLTISLLEKADETSARRLAANHREMWESLIHLWLRTSNIALGVRAGIALFRLIKTAQDDGFKRFFLDRDVYAAVFDVCSSKSSAVKLDRSERSIAQSRLLDFMAKLCELDWKQSMKSHQVEVESKYGLKSDEGLLDFAMIRATDFEQDIILERTRIMSQSIIMLSQKDKPWTGLESPALVFFKERGLHKRAMDIFYMADPNMPQIDINILYTECAAYVSTLAEVQPQLLEEKHVVRDRILKRLRESFTTSNWANTNNPDQLLIANLGVLKSLPRSCFMDEGFEILKTIKWEMPQAQGVRSLGRIFGGPTEDKHDQTSIDPDYAPKLNINEEKKRARLLFSQWITINGDFLAKLARNGNKMVDPDMAIASMDALLNIVNSNWDESPDGFEILMANSASREALLTLLLTQPQIPPRSNDHLDSLYELMGRVRLALLKAVVGKVKGTEWESLAPALSSRVNAVQSREFAQNMATLGGPS